MKLIDVFLLGFTDLALLVHGAAMFMHGLTFCCPADIENQCVVCCKPSAAGPCTRVNTTLLVQDGTGCGQGFCLNVRAPLVHAYMCAWSKTVRCGSVCIILRRAGRG